MAIGTTFMMTSKESVLVPEMESCDILNFGGEEREQGMDIVVCSLMEGDLGMQRVKNGMKSC